MAMAINNIYLACIALSKGGYLFYKKFDAQFSIYAING